MGYVILKAAFFGVAEERPFLKSLSCDNSVSLARPSVEASSVYRREGRSGHAFFLCILQTCLLINLLTPIKDSLI